jgi:BASS family bile acid:Na+ symporter
MKLLAGQFVPIDFWGMMLSIINMVILPIVAGLMFNTLAYGNEKLRSKIIQGLVYFLIIAGKNLILLQTSEIETGAALLQFTKDLAWFLLLPTIAALLFSKLKGDKTSVLNKLTALFSMAGIGAIILVITAAGRDSLLDIGLLLILACLLHNSAGYFLGYWICKLARMDEKSCRTIALEVGMQNGGLASGIALEMGRVATIGLAPAVFGPMMNITGSSLATWWRRKTENQTPTPESH